MPETGHAISHFRILKKIGGGGMGEMCRAEGRRLRRDAAISLLPEEFAREAECGARFRRNAKLPASLNHHRYKLVLGIEGKGAGGVI